MTEDIEEMTLRSLLSRWTELVDVYNGGNHAGIAPTASQLLLAIEQVKHNLKLHIGNSLA